MAYFFQACEKDKFTLCFHISCMIDVSYETLAYAAPTVHSTYTEKDYPLVTDADIYVAPDGSDDADGSFEHPFATLEKARDTVRSLIPDADGEIVVALKAGTYPSAGFILRAEDSGSAEVPIKYCAYGDGEAIISGAVDIPAADFEPISDSDKALFKAENTDNIVKVDLAKYDIDASTLDYTNELYDSDGRCRLARYPNVNEDGSDGLLYYKGWGALDTRDDMVIVKKLAEQIESYHTLEGARITGYMQYDWWCDDKAITSYNAETRTLSLERTNYGVGVAPYFYLYNVAGNNFLFGGGRDNTCINNVMICSRIEYDARFCDAYQKYRENGTV